MVSCPVVPILGNSLNRFIAGRKVATAGSTTTKLAAGVGENTPTFEAEPAPRLSDLTEDEITSLFVDFVTKFEKTYSDEDEASMRREIFRRNLKRIDEVSSRFILVLMWLGASRSPPLPDIFLCSCSSA